jgi:hypothetical protein
MVVPLRIFERNFPRLINPINTFELDCLKCFLKSPIYKLSNKTLESFFSTGWVKRHILILDKKDDIAFKNPVSVSLLEHGKKILLETENGYVWNTIKKGIDLKATRNFYMQFTRPHQYHYYQHSYTAATILPNTIAKKLFEMNDKRFNDIRDTMHMIMLKAEKIKDDWVLLNED